MIKVFTTNLDSSKAGDELTRLYEEWISSLKNIISIKNVHSNSNEHGWMLVILYESIPTEKWS